MIESQLRAIIADLEKGLADAAKVDAGKTGNPGTALRKVATEAQRSLKALRDSVLEARTANATK